MTVLTAKSMNVNDGGRVVMTASGCPLTWQCLTTHRSGRCPYFFGSWLNKGGIKVKCRLPEGDVDYWLLDPRIIDFRENRAPYYWPPLKDAVFPNGDTAPVRAFVHEEYGQFAIWLASVRHEYVLMSERGDLRLVDVLCSQEKLREVRV